VDTNSQSGSYYTFNLSASLLGTFTLREGITRTPELDEKAKAFIPVLLDFLAALGRPAAFEPINISYTEWTNSTAYDVLIDANA
jgi:hypothetical protein